MESKNFYLIEEESQDNCINCGEPCFIKYCKKYNGYRGKCPSCDSNWAES